jgi:hypothetical protein
MAEDDLRCIKKGIEIPLTRKERNMSKYDLIRHFEGKLKKEKGFYESRICLGLKKVKYQRYSDEYVFCCVDCRSKCLCCKRWTTLNDDSVEICLVCDKHPCLSYSGICSRCHSIFCIKHIKRNNEEEEEYLCSKCL